MSLDIDFDNLEGTWLVARPGTPEPHHTVARGKFVDRWPQGWQQLPTRTQCLLKVDQTPPTYQRAVYAGIEGFDPLEITALAGSFPGGEFMLGWQAVDDHTRFITPSVQQVLGTNRVEFVHKPPVAPFHIFSAGTARPLNTQPIPQQPIPLLTKEIVGAYRGWRKWSLAFNDRNEPIIAGLMYTYPWEPGWNTAQGYVATNHVGKRGYGGFYVCSDMSQLLVQEPDLYAWLSGQHVYGTALLTGRLRRGAFGARATRARPEYLILTGIVDTDIKLLSIAERYGMKVLDKIGSGYNLPTGFIPYEEEPTS